MKNVFSVGVLISAVSVFSVLGATNDFPADGSVRIGTTDSAYAKLDVRSDVYPAAVIWAKSFTSPSFQIWQNNLTLRQRYDDAVLAGRGPGLGGEPFCGISGGSQYYGAGSIKFLKETAATLNQDTSITFITRAGSSNATTDTEKMRITSSGNVGIGTDSPTAKLTVIGTISAKEVKVTASGFPDYVFANDYKLRSLEDVEAHIKEHKHLPGIPSAKEVEKDGLALSEIAQKQMEKIEEMTLYLIEMKKQNTAMKMQCDELRNRIDALEKK